jgi:hypothetical protein
LAGLGWGTHHDREMPAAQAPPPSEDPREVSACAQSMTASKETARRELRYLHVGVISMRKLVYQRGGWSEHSGARVVPVGSHAL